MRTVSLVPVRAATLATLAVTIPLAVSACSSGGPSSGTATASVASPPAASGSAATSSATPQEAATSALCADVAALHAAVTQLTHVKLSRDTAGTVAANANQAVTALNNLSRDTDGQFGDQVSAVRGATDNLRASVQALSAGSGSITQALSALRSVTEQTNTLVSAAGRGCPLPSPSG